MPDRRRLMVLLAQYLTLSSLTMAACGGGGTSPDGGTGATSGSLRATIDGTPWVADATTIQVSGSAAAPGALTITGTHVESTAHYQSVVLTLGYVDGPKTYPLGVNPGTNAGGSANVTDQSGAATVSWMTDLVGARGSLTVTSMTASRFAGTFLFTAPPQPGSVATTTRTVTDGSFDLPVPPAFQPPAADDYGSSIVATVNGQPWNGATIVGVGDTATGALSFGGSTTGISIDFVTATPVSAGGTFDQSAIHLMASDATTGDSWGSAGTVSSVTVTTLSGKRIAGTFTATLPPLAGATGPLTITSGTFDVRIDPA